MLKYIGSILFVLFCYTCLAFNGDISFNQSEQWSHERKINQIVSTAATCLDNDLKHHQSFHRKHGISAFYGDRSAFAKMSRSDRMNYLRRLGKDPALVDQMEPTSCVGLTLKCLERGFESAGQSNLWNRIEQFTRLNHVDGTALQYALQKLGWRVLYWNPDTSMNEAWDAQEKADDPENDKRFWGWHSYRWLTIKTRGTYMYNPVDDAVTLVDFGRRPPRSFKKAPFFVGTAHTGYHVFPGKYGHVIEGHSTRDITDYNTIEDSQFNPLQTGGGPRGSYFSGLMALPPGY